MTGPISLEGGIRLRLHLADEVIQGAEITSTRPIPGDTPFCGREPEEVLQLLPLVYAVCGTAQGVAALRAFEAAQGMTVAPVHERARDLLVAVEMAREHWATVVREAEQWCGAAFPDQRRARVHQWPHRLRTLLYPDGDWAYPGGGRLRPDYGGLYELIDEVARTITDVIAVPVAGVTRGAHVVEEDYPTAPTLLEWFQECGLATFGASPLAPLPAVSGSEWEAWLAADADARFRTCPTWEGATCETGPLARQYQHPLVAVALARFGAGVASRQLARVVELVGLPERLVALADELTEARPGPVDEGVERGSGVGVVETARGRLVHWAAIDDGRVTGHRILAPTEWNFHPEGPLARGLRGQGRTQGAGVEEGAEALLRSLDPCVGYTIEVEDA